MGHWTKTILHFSSKNQQALMLAFCDYINYKRKEEKEKAQEPVTY
jgi:hypothetical protein